jgi:uncharacterized protein YqgC (DUF456 family)
MDPDIVWVAIGSVLMLLGLIGCVLPVLPGPPLSFIGLCLLQFTGAPPFTWAFLFFWLAVTVAVTLLDYVIPALGAKKYGGSKQGVWGTMIGLIAGIFLFPPLGIVIGPILGALIGEMIAGKTAVKASKAAFGSFVGFVVGATIKMIASAVMTYHFFINI